MISERKNGKAKCRVNAEITANLWYPTLRIQLVGLAPFLHHIFIYSIILTEKCDESEPLISCVRVNSFGNSKTTTSITYHLNMFAVHRLVNDPIMNSNWWFASMRVSTDNFYIKNINKWINMHKFVTLNHLSLPIRWCGIPMVCSVYILRRQRMREMKETARKNTRRLNFCAFCALHTKLVL